MRQSADKRLRPDTDANPYVVVFQSKGFFPVTLALPANSGGLIFNEPADANGVFELRDTNCALLAKAATDAGRVLVTVSAGNITVESGADLSQRPPSPLAKTSCPTSWMHRPSSRPWEADWTDSRIFA